MNVCKLGIPITTDDISLAKLAVRPFMIGFIVQRFEEPVMQAGLIDSYTRFTLRVLVSACRLQGCWTALSLDRISRPAANYKPPLADAFQATRQTQINIGLQALKIVKLVQVNGDEIRLTDHLIQILFDGYEDNGRPVPDEDAYVPGDEICLGRK
jgi:hypothetical protein